MFLFDKTFDTLSTTKGAMIPVERIFDLFVHQVFLTREYLSLLSSISREMTNMHGTCARAHGLRGSWSERCVVCVRHGLRGPGLRGAWSEGCVV